MAKTMRVASDTVLSLMGEAMGAWHKGLLESEVAVAVLMVEAPRDADGNITGVALKLHGTPCRALIKIASPELRLIHGCDAVMKIDADGWDEMEDEERLALLDHELTHLVVLTDEAGCIKYHADNRPKLVMRPDDWSLTGFAEVVQRHREHALELQALRGLVFGHDQMLLRFMTESERTDSAGPISAGHADVDDAIAAQDAEDEREAMSGIDSITLSSRTKSMTLTPQEFQESVDNVVRTAKRPKAARVG